MGRIKLDDIDKYSSGNGAGGFFKLSKDKEVGRVRIMLDKPDDIENYIYAVHEVKMPDGKQRYVNCLRDYDEPIEKCPFCEAKMKIVPKVFVPLYNLDTDEMQIWERGKKFLGKLTSFMTRYGKKSSIVSHIVEIERNGKPNDQQTTYELYETEKDETTLEDLDEFPDVLGWVILDKSEDDMNTFLDTGEFPPEDGEQPSTIRRRGKRAEEEELDEEDDSEEANEDSDEEEEEPKRRSSRRGSEEKSTGRRTPGKSRRSF